MTDLQDADGVLARILQDMRVVVCVGSGGVGKTTTAAALGLYAATLGKRTLIITIDPARRLANALGLDALDGRPKALDAERLAAAGLRPTATIDAMMLDLTAAWDDLVTRVAPDPETSAKLQDNRFYRHLTRDLPGAQDFIACEALYSLVESGNYDLIVLDTPPTANALDFLEAPNRILSFLDNEALKNFYGKVSGEDAGFAAKMGLRFLDGASGAVQSVLAKIAGKQVLEDLAEFFGLLRDFFGPLSERTRGFEEVLRGPTTRFCIVAAPNAGSLNEAAFFHKELGARDLALGAIVVNRVEPPPPRVVDGAGVPEIQSAIEPSVGDAAVAADLAHSIFEAAADQHTRAVRHRNAIGVLEEETAKHGRVPPIIPVPRLSGDVADADRLAQLLPALVGSDGQKTPKA